MEELKESLLFEIEVAKISTPREERRNASAMYNPTTAEMNEKYPGTELGSTLYDVMTLIVGIYDFVKTL